MTLETDPRTAWAFHEYEEHKHHSVITPSQEQAVLNHLGTDEHVEIILVGGLLSNYERKWVRKSFSKGRFPNLSKSLTATTMSRTLIVSPDGTSVTSLDNRRWDGIPMAKIIIVYKLSSPHDYIWFERTGERAHRILRVGAGEFILRLPSQPGVPDIPSTLKATSDNQRAAPRRIESRLTGWESAEAIAEHHLRDVGFANVRLTGSGSDHGLDVMGSNIAAQVKMTALPVGRPVLQQLLGAAVMYSHRACYSSSGYTSEAISYADSCSVALFVITEQGLVVSVNDHAEHMERTVSMSDESFDWRRAYSYADEVASRMLKWLNEKMIDLVSKNLKTGSLVGGEARSNRAAHAISYWNGVLKTLEEASEFQTGRDMIIHYHHAELLLAVAVRSVGFDYANPPSEVDSTGNSRASIADFY